MSRCNPHVFGLEEGLVMSRKDHKSLADESMLDLFRLEVEQQSAVLMEGLMRLEQGAPSSGSIEPLMRAAHSIKGAARLVGIMFAVVIAHVMEDCLVAAQHGKLSLSPDDIDVLLKGNDLLSTIAQLTEQASASLSAAHQAAYDYLLEALADVLAGRKPAQPTEIEPTPPPASPHAAAPQSPAADIVEHDADAKPVTPIPVTTPKPKEKPPATQAADRVLRISAEQLNRLMGLAGESMVEARWLRPYAESMLRLKRRQAEIITLLDGLREELDERRLDRDSFRRLLRETQGKAAECRQILADRLAELEAYDRRAVNLSSRLRRGVVPRRMRPFGDGVQGFPRVVRDLAVRHRYALSTAAAAHAVGAAGPHRRNCGRALCISARAHRTHHACRQVHHSRGGGPSIRKYRGASRRSRIGLSGARHQRQRPAA